LANVDLFRAEQGMDADAYTQINLALKKLFNINLDNYKSEQMKRRLDSWLIRRQMASWKEYLVYIDQHADEKDRFRDYLTINVTEFFRDPERWKSLRNTYIPALLKDPRRPAGLRNGLRVWSAGCSTGVEAYTLAILLDEVAPAQAHYLLASDIDRGALQKARARGPYPPEETRNLTPEQRQKYFSGATALHVKESLAQKVTFKEEDLFAARFEAGFDLIICRNVVIYFTPQAKDALYARFNSALRCGGILFLGGTEIISHPVEFGFRNREFSFYEKTEA
jgi:chemotaxis protein methyltransferase CheR